MKLKFKYNKGTVFYFLLVCVFLFSKNSFKNEFVYLDSTLSYIRISNIILSFLALSGIYLIYNKTKNSIIFLLLLMYLCLSIDIVAGKIDYFIFNNKEFSFSNYINITTSIFRMCILIIATYPNSKIHKFIHNNAKASILFVITYCFIEDIFFSISNFKALINHNYFFIMYNIILIIIYINSCFRLWKLSRKNTFILKYFSLSIFLLIIKAMYAIYGFFNISFNLKLISVSITSLFFIVIIIAVGVKLYATIDEYNLLNNELMKYFNFVENNKHSNMFICDYDMNIIYINKKIEEYYNYQDSMIKFKKDLIGNKSFSYKLKDIISSLNNQGYWSGIIKDIENDEILECYAQKLDISNDKKEVLVSYIDIREKLELEERLENLKLRDLKKDEFISNISHELKTPVNIFYSTLQLLETYSKNKNIDFNNVFSKHKDSLKLNCKRMIRLINNIVDICRIDLGSLKPNYGNYNIVLLIEDIVNSIVPFALSKDLNIVFDTNYEEHYIMCDPMIIERILLNLLSNSIKYSNRNSRISVLVSVKEDITKISVIDNGVGIDLGSEIDIFDRFTRVDNSFVRLNEGSGIGLSIVKSMLDLIDGKISVKSELGKGSTFEISLDNKLIESQENKNYAYESDYNVSVELSDIYELS